MKHFLRPYCVEKLKVRRGMPAISSKIGVLAIAGVLTIAGVARANALGLQIAQILDERSLLLLHSHSRGYLGVDVADMDQDRAQALHLKDARGAEITVLDHDAPAGKAGLRLHDVIVQVNGKGIENAEQVKEILHATAPGKKLQLVVSRDGAQQTVSVQMADRRKMQEEAMQQLGSSGSSRAQGQAFLSGGGDVQPSGGFHLWGMGSSLHVGALVEPLTAQMADFLGVTGGLMIKSVARKSAADAAGLKPHDVILEIGGETVVTSSDWERLLRASEGKPVQVEIFRDRVKQLVLLQVDGKRH